MFSFNVNYVHTCTVNSFLTKYVSVLKANEAMIFRCFFSYFSTYFLLINISINTDLYSDKFTLTVTKNMFWAHKIHQCVLVVPVFTLRQMSFRFSHDEEIFTRPVCSFS